MEKAKNIHGIKAIMHLAKNHKAIKNVFVALRISTKFVFDYSQKTGKNQQKRPYKGRFSYIKKQKNKKLSFQNCHDIFNKF